MSTPYQIQITNSEVEVLLQGLTPKVDKLFIHSTNLEDLLARPRIAIVGSRKVTPYGKQITAQFAGELAKQGVVIVSGLAYGVDAVAHRAALDAGGLTIAVLPGSVETPYPSAHRGLAEQIVESGGALLSEYPAGTTTYKTNFIARNRIVSGISNALLITEAVENSGTMHTARFALEQGKDVLAVPGNITSPTSAGTNNLIKSGATAVTSPQDVMHILGIKPAAALTPIKSSDKFEQCILDLLGNNVSEGSDLLTRSDLPPEKFSQALTMLEITGKIRPLGGNHWAIQ